LLALLALPAFGRSSQTVGRVRFSWDPNPEPIVTGYKIHWGTESGVYTESVDVGNVTEAVIQDFFEGVEFYAAITAYADTGEESDYSEEIRFVWTAESAAANDRSTDRMVLIEAEDGSLTAPMAIGNDGETAWIESTLDYAAAAADLSFEAPLNADYYVWCRVQAPDSAHDSFRVAIDSETEAVYHVHGQEAGPASAYAPGWIWSRIEISPGQPRTYPLEAGTHTLRFRHREPTLLDRVVIVTDPDFVPDDALPRQGEVILFSQQPGSRFASEGASVSFTARVTSTHALTYQWFSGSGEIAGATSPTLELKGVTAADSGSYTLLVSSPSAFAESAPAELLVSDGPGGFRIETLDVSSGGQLTIQVGGTDSTAIDVFASTDLRSWTRLGTATPVGGQITLQDPTAAGRQQRFYRLDDGQP